MYSRPLLSPALSNQRRAGREESLDQPSVAGGRTAVRRLASRYSLQASRLPLLSPHQPISLHCMTDTAKDKGDSGGSIFGSPFTHYGLPDFELHIKLCVFVKVNLNWNSEARVLFTDSSQDGV